MIDFRYVYRQMW